MRTIADYRASGMLSLTAAEQTFSLYFLFGRIFHAVGPGLEGEAALARALRLGDAEYRFDTKIRLPRETTISTGIPDPIVEPARSVASGVSAGPGGGKRMRPVVTVYNSPVLSSKPSSRRPAQPLRARPSSPTEPVVLRHPIPQAFRPGPPNLAAREWDPCESLVGDPLESFPSLTGFLTGRRGNSSRPAAKTCNTEHRFPNVRSFSPSCRRDLRATSRNGTCNKP